MRHLFLLAVSLLAAAGFVRAQEPSGPPSVAYSPASGAGALQASNILNPNISAIAWFQAEAGRRNAGASAEEPGESFQMKEVEIALQALVDPWSRADFFVSVGEEEVELEEGYLTWYRLPADLSARVGKFKAGIGRFNRLHTPETPFADRPLVAQNFLGDEGLAGPGASLSWHVPNPWLFLDLNLEALSTPSEENPSFAKVEQKDNVYVGRLSGYWDLSDSWNATLGGSAAAGNGGEEFNAVSGSSTTLSSRLYVADLTVRWKNPRRAIYRSLVWSTEALWSRRDATAESTVHGKGWFTYIDLQFARRWHAGGRYDRSGFPLDADLHESGVLAFLTFTPSEFSSLSLQGRQVQRTDGTLERLAFLKTTFNIGPHGSHPF